VSGQIEYWLGRAAEWERVLGDLEAFKANLANMKERWPEEQRITEAARRHREGWGKMYDPSVPGGVVWFPPGTHNIPQGGFVDPHAPPGPPTLPPVLAEAVRAEAQSAVRTEVQSAVREILQEAGLLSQKKSGGAAA
jgi:hypothetical protein